MRIYLKQPSPSWLDFSLRNITCFTKRVDHSSTQAGTSSSLGSPTTNQSTRLGSAGSSTTEKNGGAAGFDGFRSKLRSNLQGVKKQTKNQASEDEDESGMNSLNVAKMVGSAVHNYTEQSVTLALCKGFI